MRHVPSEAAAELCDLQDGLPRASPTGLGLLALTALVLPAFFLDCHSSSAARARSFQGKRQLVHEVAVVAQYIELNPASIGVRSSRGSA